MAGKESTADFASLKAKVLGKSGKEYWRSIEDMKLNPLNNNVVILIDNEVQEVRNGIILANPTVTAKPNVGKVVAVHNNSPIVQVGDQVMYLKHSGTGFKEDALVKESPEYKVISEKDILGIVEDGNYG